MVVRLQFNPLCVISLSWVMIGLLVIAGCGRQDKAQTAASDEQTSTEISQLEASTEPGDEDVAQLHIEEMRIEELATDLRGEPTGAAAAEIGSVRLQEALVMESAAASIQPPEFSVPPLPGPPSRSLSTKKIRAAITSPSPDFAMMEAPRVPVANAPAATFSAPEMAAAQANAPFETLPSGSVHNPEEKFARVKVFYATDRAPAAVPLSAYHIKGEKELVQTLAATSAVMFVVALISWFRRRPRFSAVTTVFGVTAMAASVAFFVLGRTTIEKHGVSYVGERGILTRGVCEVTVPVVHQKGMVERPSLLRFEFREDQDQHIVLTSAIEMQKDAFHQQLSKDVTGSPDRDLLVFIHGYNVDFESAVQRTAQISIDLPFEGVPVCYSWPSQGKLLGYSIDENNAQWSVTHLREFLQELASQSGADSINVVAHSMGNRAMTQAMQQIAHQSDELAEPMFDRVVLAAPDVDADHFRRDLAPALLQVANQVTLYASSDDRALIASKKVHGYPRAGESGADLVVVPGIETIDVSGIDLSLLGHSYYGDNESMLRDLYEVVRARLPATRRRWLIPRQVGALPYWQLAHKPTDAATH